MFFNPSIGATITAGGRAIIAVAILSIEAVGGKFRNYSIDAYSQLIQIAKEQTDDLKNKYTLPKTNVDEVLNHLLKGHDDYYLKTFLRNLLTTLSEDELSVLYVKNNFNVFIRIPEVNEHIKHILDLNNRIEEELSEKDENIWKSINKQYGDILKDKKSYMIYYSKSDKFKESSEKLKQMSAELLLGFYYYNGDHYKGHYHETHVELAEHIDRDKVPTSDTDSTVTTLFNETIELNNLFDYKMENKFIEEIITSIISMIIYEGLISYSLDRYVKTIGVNDEYAKLVWMEPEYLMHDLHSVENKKQYIFNYFTLDGNFNDDIFGSVKIKGLPLIKSDYNRDISKKVKNLITENIMVRTEDLNYAKVINDSKDLTDYLKGYIRNDDFILNKSTTKKANKTNDELAFGDARNKIARLWTRFNIPGEISFPGSYKEVEVKFTYDILDELKEKLPHFYKCFEEHTLEIKEFNLYRTIINKAIKIKEDNFFKLEFIKDKDVSHYGYIKDTIDRLTTINPDTTFNKERAYLVINRIFGKDISPEYIKINKKIFNIPNKVISLDINYDDIIEHIDRIGMPVSLQIVPEFFKIQDYSLINDEFSATGEYLIGHLVNAMGIQANKNRNGNIMITSVLQTY